MATKKKLNAKAWEIGAGVTAAALAAAAGAYLLSNKKTKAKAKAWAVKARTEVAKHAKAAKKLTKADYERLVDQAVKHYKPIKDMTAADVVAAGKSLKGEWDKIQTHAKRLSGGKAKVPARRKTATKRKTPSKKSRA